MKKLLLVLIALILVPVAWRLRHHESVQALVRPAPPPPPPIQFDNGSVRDSTQTVRVPAADLPTPDGKPRRCQRGTEVIYTQTACPAGAREVAMDKGTVNVVAAETPRKPPQGPQLPPLPSARAPADGKPSLQDQMMERATR
jgi:hypothetical protein